MAVTPNSDNQVECVHRDGGDSMQHATAVGSPDTSLRDHIRRILVNDRTAWWSRLLARAGAAHAVVFLGGAVIEAAARKYLHQPPNEGLGPGPVWGAAILAAVVAIFSFFTMENPKPPQQRLNRRQWSDHAFNEGGKVALGVGYILFVLAGYAGKPLSIVIDSVDQLTSQNWALNLIVSVITGVLPVGLYLVLPAVLACFALSARYDQEIRILEAATPAELRLAAEIHRRAEAFRAQAEALEHAIEQAAAISEQVQLELKQEQAEISRMREEYLRQVRLRELSSEDSAAIQDWLGQENARTGRRTFWSSLALGVALFLAGILADALLLSEALGEQLQQWLHLG